ncbi:MAG: AglZ/HisF2 family acetamidino modification protein [Bacteroidota bacterium]
MVRKRIIPVLLLNEGGLYKTVEFKKASYVGDPINTVKIFNEKEVDELVILDFQASKQGRGIDFAKITEIAGEAFMPMAYGGGIKTFEDAKKVIDAGFEKVVLNSILFSEPLLARKIADVYGEQSVIGAMDVKKNLFGKYGVYSHSGTVKTGETPVEWAKKLAELGAGEIVVNSIDKDGTWSGYDEGLIRQVSSAVGVPVIACGGAGSLEDLKKGIQAGASAVAAGSLFIYQKKGMGVLISFPSTLRV